LNRTSYTGSGYKNGVRYQSGKGCQGGSTYVDKRFNHIIEQNTEIPPKNDFTVPCITIKLI